MTLEEAIKRYTDNAEYERTHGNLQGCLDFKQLAEWLREFKAYRKSWEYLFATIYEIKSNAENDDIKNITNFLLKYMRIYEKRIKEVKADADSD